MTLLGKPSSAYFCWPLLMRCALSLAGMASRAICRRQNRRTEFAQCRASGCPAARADRVCIGGDLIEIRLEDIEAIAPFLSHGDCTVRRVVWQTPDLSRHHDPTLACEV